MRRSSFLTPTGLDDGEQQQAGSSYNRVRRGDTWTHDLQILTHGSEPLELYLGTNYFFFRRKKAMSKHHISHLLFACSHNILLGSNPWISTKTKNTTILTFLMKRHNASFSATSTGFTSMLTTWRYRSQPRDVPDVSILVPRQAFQGFCILIFKA